jgi:hypothetical protein
MDNNIEIKNAIEALSLLYSEMPSDKLLSYIKEVESQLTDIAYEAHQSSMVEAEIQNPSNSELLYIPLSKSCRGLDTLVPAKQRYEMLKALGTIDRIVGGVDEYVADRLGYINGNCSIEKYKEGMQCLCNAFSAEQVDAIAMAIYNIEEKNQGCIIGDMTGIGKGRIAAGLIVYAVNQGKLPIFFTEKTNLFSDIYRDLIAINADAGIPQVIVDKNKYTTRVIKASKKEIEDKIKSDISDGDFELEGFNTEQVLSDNTVMKKAVEQYRELYYEDKIEEVYSSYKNGNYENDIKGKNQIVPFIINTKDKKTNILDEDNSIIYYGQNDD